jgi:hypothetical protein
MFAPAFLCPLQAAQADQRLPAGLFRRHARAQVVFDMELKVALQFLRQFPFSPLFAEHAHQSHQNCAQLSHIGSGYDVAENCSLMNSPHTHGPQLLSR